MYRASNYFQPSHPTIPQMPKLYPYYNGMFPFVNMHPYPTYLPPMFPIYNQGDERYFKNPINFYCNNFAPSYHSTTLPKPPELVQRQ